MAGTAPELGKDQTLAKMIVPLVPPKPKELESATFTLASRAMLAT
jgi:hypothetical protein